eukprot:8921163-Lingulodinium_polyedra.AAC.1
MGNQSIAELRSLVGALQLQGKGPHQICASDMECAIKPEDSASQLSVETKKYPMALQEDMNSEKSREGFVEKVMTPEKTRKSFAEKVMTPEKTRESFAEKLV